MDWQDLPPTEKQKEAICNMRRALDWINETPETRGECSKLIGEMKLEISNRLSATGYISSRYFNDSREDDGDMFDAIHNSW